MLQINVKRKFKEFLILKSESFQHNTKPSFRRENKSGPTKLNIKVPQKASKHYFTYIAYYSKEMSYTKGMKTDSCILE